MDEWFELNDHPDQWFPRAAPGPAAHEEEDGKTEQYIVLLMTKRQAWLFLVAFVLIWVRARQRPPIFNR